MHRVQQGECLGSIAAKYRRAWKDIWDHAENKPLRDKRKDPNVLLPGDVVFLPERTAKAEPAATNKRHHFKVHKEKVTLHLRIVGALEPLKNEPYLLQLGETTLEGETDGEGKIAEEIPADFAEVILQLPRRRQWYTLVLGNLDPPDVASGAEDRLRNLGMIEATSAAGADLATALALFQRVKSLEETGELDDATAAALRDEHGC